MVEQYGKEGQPLLSGVGTAGKGGENKSIRKGREQLLSRNQEKLCYGEKRCYIGEEVLLYWRVDEEGLLLDGEEMLFECRESCRVRVEIH